LLQKLYSWDGGTVCRRKGEEGTVGRRWGGNPKEKEGRSATCHAVSICLFELNAAANAERSVGQKGKMASTIDHFREGHCAVPKSPREVRKPCSRKGRLRKSHLWAEEPGGPGDRGRSSRGEQLGGGKKGQVASYINGGGRAK